MTNLITLTIPNDDHIALRAFGKALEEMALAHGAEPRKTDVGELSYDVNAVQSGVNPEITNAYMQGCYDTEARLAETDTTSQQVESLSNKEWPKEQCPVTGAVHDVDPSEVPHSTLLEDGIDSTGTPWDERIHSASKALNADGTWRLRRKPKDMDEEQWYQLIADVKLELSGEEQYDQEELTRQMDELGVRYDPAHDKGDETAEFTVEPPVTLPGDDFHTDAGVVTEQTVAGIPPIPVPPPVVVAPPVPEVTTWDFPKLMKFLTERHGKIDVPTVNQLLVVDGLAALTDLNAHPDKIGPFVARVKAHLGE